MSFTKVFKILFDLPKILWSLWLLKFLLACIMVNPISLVVILTFLVIIILSLLTQYVCEYPQSSLILINYLSGWAAILLTGIGSRPVQLSLIVSLILFSLSILDQSICSWSLDLKIIITLLIKRWTIQLFYKPMHLQSFFLWLGIDTHISPIVDRHIHCWIIIRQCPSHLITLWVLPLIPNAFVKLYPPLGQPYSAFGLVLFTLETCGICF